MKIYLIGANGAFQKRIYDALQQSGYKDATVIIGSKLSAEDVIQKAPDCEILVASPSGFQTVSKELMLGLPQLKFVSTMSVGTDWINLVAAKEQGIIVSTQQGVNAEAVAQHCFGMILDLAKQITQSDRGLHEKGEYRQSPYMGRELYGKTLGIIGLGNIGTKVARIASGFAMQILGVNNSKHDVSGVKLVSLETLLKESDVVAVTVPLTPQTQNLLDKKTLALLKKDAILVSISREMIIDKKAVIDLLEKKHLFGYGYDAEINVPFAKDDPILQFPNVVITTHTAGETLESNKGYVSKTVENIEAFLAGNAVRVVI